MGDFVIVLWAMVAFVIIMPIVFICISHDEKRHAEEMREEIRKTKLIHVSSGNTTSRTSTHGAVGGAVVGWAIAGPIGGIIGASSAKQRTYTSSGPAEYQFMVYYYDGTRKVDTVKQGKPLYDVYMEKLELDDEDRPRRRRSRTSWDSRKLPNNPMIDLPDAPVNDDDDDDIEELLLLPENASIKLPSPKSLPIPKWNSEPSEDKVVLLSKLSELHHAGILTHEEYVAKVENILHAKKEEEIP